MFFRSIFYSIVLLVGAAFGLDVIGMAEAAEGEIRVGRKTLRQAEEAYQAGRFEESLRLYEAILTTVPESDERVGTALFGAAMIRLSDDPELRDREIAFEHLRRLAGLTRAELRREAGAMLTLEKEQLDLQAKIEDLEAALDHERAAAIERCTECERGLEEKDAELDVQVRSIELLNREVVGLHQQITKLREIGEDREVRIATREMEIELLIDQLSGSQEDQSDMLAAVARKNEELLKTEAELSRIRARLQEKETTLESKEIELQEKELAVEKREEAIRKAAESILSEPAEEP